MRISFERFRQSVGGALDVLEEDGWIRFHRFSAAASDALRGVNDFERKSYGTAGICLRFRTDAGGSPSVTACGKPHRIAARGLMSLRTEPAPRTSGKSSVLQTAGRRARRRSG